MRVQNSLFIHQVSIGRLFLVQTFTYVMFQVIALVLVPKNVIITLTQTFLLVHLYFVHAFIDLFNV